MINEKAEKLGEALVSAQILSRPQLDNALLAASKTGAPSLIVGLLEAGYLTFKVFEKFMSASLGIKGSIIGEREIKPEILAMVSFEVIRGHFLFPIDLVTVGGVRTLLLGMVDPLDTEVIDSIKKKSGTNVVSFLISLPDFKNSLERFFPSYAGDQVALRGDTQDEKMVVIRPGGFEDEIAELTSSGSGVPGKESPGEIDLEAPAQGSSVGQTKKVDRARDSAFLGRNRPRFKEEILGKLELIGSDAKRFTNETYTRESLFKEVPEVSSGPLIEVYKKTTPEMRIEAVVNALILKGLLTKRDILHSSAVSYIFAESAE